MCEYCKVKTCKVRSCETKCVKPKCCNPCKTVCEPCRPNRCEITSPEPFLAQLNGCNEVPPTNSAAVGTLVGLLSVDNLRFDFALETNGLANISAAHFHLGPRCQNGPIVRTIAINFADGSAVGVWSSSDPQPLTPQLVQELKRGNIYVNIHTAQFPAGEIRGQIYPAKIKFNN